MTQLQEVHDSACGDSSDQFIRSRQSDEGKKTMPRPLTHQNSPVMMTPTDKKPPQGYLKMKQAEGQQSTSESSSLCNSDELTIVREHMHFIVGLLLAPDFKRMVNWLSLDSSQVTLQDHQFDRANLRNFVILTALKIQSLTADLKESQDLN